MNTFFEQSVSRGRVWGSIFALLGGVVITLTLTACTSNEPFRTGDPAICSENQCDAKTMMEQYHGEYDLAFVEFTERGNVFNRPKMQQVLNHVKELAKTPDGVAVIVFVHGWKHNASYEDENVKEFRRLLAQTGQMTKQKRGLIYFSRD